MKSAQKWDSSKIMYVEKGTELIKKEYKIVKSEFYGIFVLK